MPSNDSLKSRRLGFTGLDYAEKTGPMMAPVHSMLRHLTTPVLPTTAVLQRAGGAMKVSYGLQL